MQSITRTDVQGWIRQLSSQTYERGGQSKTYSPEQVRDVYNLFAAMMRLAHDEGMIARTPWTPDQASEKRKARAAPP